MRYYKFCVGSIIVAYYIVIFSRYLLPPEKLRLDKTTTYLVEPLADDGLPNYALAIIERQRAGVTNENNCAPLFWQAIGPTSLDDESFSALCDELEIDRLDLPTSSYLVSITSDETIERFARWATQSDKASPPRPGEPLSEETIESGRAFLESISLRPWSSQTFPSLANWLKENDAPLDMLVEASRKPHFFSPSSGESLNPDIAVAEMLLPHVQAARDVVRSLTARAMHRLSLGQHQQAWEDVHACWRYGQLVGRQSFLVESLVSISMRQAARNATIAILDSPTLPKPLAKQIQAELQTLNSSVDLTAVSGFYERLFAIDIALRHATNRLDGIDGEALGTPMPPPRFDVDLNIILQSINTYYDQLASAVGDEDWRKRAATLEEIEADLARRSAAWKTKALLTPLSRSQYSQLMGDTYLLLTSPGASYVVETAERDETGMVLVRTAAALARYRLEYGEYPGSLADLVTTDMLKQIPNDPFTGEPLAYERRTPGYLLYSLALNRTDDGGDDGASAIVDGEWVSKADFVAPESDACDIVIRLPLPPLELPIPPTAKTAEP